MSKKDFVLRLNIDQDVIPSNIPSQRVLEITLQAPTAAAISSRPMLNLALVLDRSGSMSGERLEYAKLAAQHVIDLLSDQDRAALVVYDDEVNLLSPSLHVTDANRAELKQALSHVQTGGSTNLSSGWLAGCQEVAAAAQEGSLNRTLLLTDGMANQGILDLETLAAHAREVSVRGVSTSTFGVGQGFNEHLLEAMSTQGGGNFYYIEAPSAIPAIFAQEFKELSAVTARNVELILEIPPQVSAQVLGAWHFETTPGKLSISLGSLNLGRAQELYVKLLTPPAGDLKALVLNAVVTGGDEAGNAFNQRAEITLRYSSQQEAETAPKRMDVLERYAHVDLAETANAALKLERMGEKERASRLMVQSIAANAPYVGAQKIDEYQTISEHMKKGMDEADRKQTHYANYNQRRSR